MLDPKKIAEFEQSIATIRELIPSGLKAMYDGCIEKGFTQQEAFYFAAKWMELALSGNGSTEST